ncbi:uncharacterized protein LOC121890463 [Thunnus maccoyii]|uniref:uncharacterized protein LOC121890463 n=1 Tax=Thunnus maccoyii TaxID=8240 RepID=UPI001C4D3609|nr:uncharacterized protein LOC121890463 [Thunnus maccoyii]
MDHSREVKTVGSASCGRTGTCCSFIVKCVFITTFGIPTEKTNTADLQTFSSLQRSAEIATFSPESVLSLQKSKMVDGVEISVHIIGDAARPLKQRLMKGFPQHQLSQEQTHFTHALSSARVAIENSFGRLKGRWRCLMKRNGTDLNLMPNFVTACCILHNVHEIQKDSFLPEWNIEVDQPEGLGQPHAVVYKEERPNTAQLCATLS